MRINLDYEKHIAFITPYSIFRTRVIQQGDYNAPATFQKFMCYILREGLGKFVYIYLDDLMIFSDSFEEHKKHVR